MQEMCNIKSIFTIVEIKTRRNTNRIRESTTTTRICMLKEFAEIESCNIN